MSLALIVAMANNRAIGLNNQLLWHLPRDLQYFKSVTLGKPVIMGRKTHEGIGFVLPGRDNIVVSRNVASRKVKGASADRVYWASSLDEAIAQAQSVTSEQGTDEIMIIGGAQIYEQALPRVNKIYLTQVNCHLEGDTFFPQITLDQWQETARNDCAACAKNPYPYSFVVYDRVG